MVESYFSIPFLIAYGISSCTLIMISLYLLTSRQPAWADNPRPRQQMRREAGLLTLVFAASHLYTLLFYLFTPSLIVGNIFSTFIDMLLSVPLVIHLLMNLPNNGFSVSARMTQWSYALLADIPVVACLVGYLVTFDNRWYTVVIIVCIAILLALALNYTFLLFRYHKWLHDNYADLEHKEKWWSFVIIAIMLLFYTSYFSFDFTIFAAYLMRFTIVVMFVFLTIWVDNMQDLNSHETEPTPNVAEADEKYPSSIGNKLETLAREQQFYLQYDISLPQLALKLGTNRTYLSQYFTSQGTNYNAYINDLRVAHFIHLYKKTAKTDATISLKELAFQSGFQNYSTFSSAFKRSMGCSPSDWMREK